MLTELPWKCDYSHQEWHIRRGLKSGLDGPEKIFSQPTEKGKKGAKFWNYVSGQWNHEQGFEKRGPISGERLAGFIWDGKCVCCGASRGCWCFGK